MTRKVEYTYHTAKHATPIRPMADDEDKSLLRAEPGTVIGDAGYVVINPQNKLDKLYLTPQQYADRYQKITRSDPYIELANDAPVPKPKRRRRTRAQMEADAALTASGSD